MAAEFRLSTEAVDASTSEAELEATQDDDGRDLELRPIPKRTSKYELPSTVSIPTGKLSETLSDKPVRPLFGCLSCGYPLVDRAGYRCSECGAEHDEDTLDYWFSGDEAKRFENVTWLVAAALFVRLLLLPQFLSLSRLAGAVAACAACWVAFQGKQRTVGGYFALSGIIVSALMGFVFCWSLNALPYYTLDMVVACALVLGMFHDPVHGTVGRRLWGRQVALVLLPAGPLVGTGCYLIDQFALGGAASLGTSALPPQYDPLRVLVPFILATGVWLFAWFALRDFRWRIFRGGEEEAS